jgi:hypothetical protein
MMEELISALKQFETRNNISASIIVNSDGSFGIMEFWTEEDLGSFDTLDKLLKFLSDTQYELDDKGVCLSPCKIK